MTDVHVAVIGAGISGLAVADRLVRAGRTVQVFEARSRLGGRITSVEVAGGHADLGPTWFWPGEHRTAELVELLGVPVHDHWTTGDLLYAANGAIQRVVAPGLPSSYRFSDGASGLITGLASRLPMGAVELSTPVERVERGRGHVTIHTSDRSVTASAVVIALPPALAVQRGMIPISDLDPAIGQIAANIPTWMGAVTKSVAVYREPFWRHDGLSGTAISPGRPFNEIHDMAGPGGLPAMLFGFGESKPPRPALTADTFIHQLMDLFGPRAGDVIDVFSVDWHNEPFTMSPDAVQKTNYELLGSPSLQQPTWDGRLLWSSTETSSVAPGHIEGALAAAERTVAALSAR